MADKEIGDGDYLARRAREERQRAALCADSAAALVHLKMAEEYDRRLAAGEQDTPARASN